MKTRNSSKGMQGTAAAGVLCATLALASVFAVQAGEVFFTNVDGSGDIASAAAWGGTLPATGDTPVFSGTFPSLSASADVAFAGLKVAYAGTKAHFDFSETPARQVTLSGTLAVGSSARNEEVLFTKGNWQAKGYFDFGSNNGCGNTVVFSNATLSCAYLNTYGRTNRVTFAGADASLAITHAGTYNIFSGSENELTLTDGATWTHDANGLYLDINRSASNCVFRVMKNARFSTARGFFAGYSATEYNNRVEILDGGYFKAGSLTLNKNHQSVIISNGTLETSGYLTLNGTGCRLAWMGPQANYLFTHSSPFSIFGTSGPRDALVEILDGATWEFNTNNVYTTANNAAGCEPINCTFRVADGGRFVSSKNIYWGYHPSETSNRLEVLNGGEVKVGEITLDRIGQELFVSNATLRCTGTCARFPSYNSAGGFTSISNRITIAGAQTVLDFKNMRNDLFQSGFGHVVTISDGATWEYVDNDGNANKDNYYTCIDSRLHHNTLRVTRGGLLKMQNGFQFGYNRDSSNRLEVTEGGCVYSPGVRMGGVDNVCVVSNGLVAATNGYLYIGHSWGDNNTNLLCVVSGTNSLLTANYGVEVSRGATLRFEIPTAGYARVPLQVTGYTNANQNVTGDILFEKTANIEIEAAAYQRNLSRRQRVVLAQAAAKLRVDAAALTRAQTRLDEQDLGCKLAVADEDKLVLAVPAHVPTIILVR